MLKINTSNIGLTKVLFLKIIEIYIGAKLTTKEMLFLTSRRNQNWSLETIISSIQKIIFSNLRVFYSIAKMIIFLGIILECVVWWHFDPDGKTISNKNSQLHSVAWGRKIEEKKNEKEYDAPIHTISSNLMKQKSNYLCNSSI